MAKKKPAAAEFTIEDLFAEEPGPAPVAETPPPEPEPPAPVVEEVLPPAEIRHPIGLKVPIPPRPPYIEDRPEEVNAKGDQYTFDCGHTNFGSPEEHLDAQRAGFCCDSGRRKMGVHWQLLSGPYLRPLPAILRRTHENSRNRPGTFTYCCDDEGWYIGGIGNDCRHYRPEGALLCQGHRPYVPPPEKPEPEPEPEPEAVAETPKPGKSWKQRQLESRRKGGRK